MLITKANLAKPDEIYAQLIVTHEDLSDQESHALNARLILILINHIGDNTVISEALKLAKNTKVETTSQL